MREREGRPFRIFRPLSGPGGLPASSFDVLAFFLLGEEPVWSPSSESMTTVAFFFLLVVWAWAGASEETASV